MTANLPAITDTGVAIAALGTLANTLIGQYNTRKLRKIHSEVVTLNGKTIGTLADNAEGRRIMADIPIEEQTLHDKRYIEAVQKSDHPVLPKEEI